MALSSDHETDFSRGQLLQVLFCIIFPFLAFFAIHFLSKAAFDFLRLNSLDGLLTGEDFFLSYFCRQMAYAILVPCILTMFLHVPAKGVLAEGCRAVLITFSLVMGGLLVLLMCAMAVFGVSRMMLPFILDRAAPWLCTAVLFASLRIADILIPSPPPRFFPGHGFPFRFLSFLILPAALWAIPHTAYDRFSSLVLLLSFSMTARHHIIRGRRKAISEWKLITCFSLYLALTGAVFSHHSLPGHGMGLFSAILLCALHILSLLTLYLPSCRQWLMAGHEKKEEAGS